MKPSHSYRTLIVDDDPAMHDIFSRMLAPAAALEPAGATTRTVTLTEPRFPAHFPTFEIDSAFHGAEGLDCVRNALSARPYTMAFVDFRMPSGWDGIETVSRVWKECFDLQIVICTGHLDFSWQDIIRRFGHSDRLLILKKPFNVTEVRQVAYSLAEKWDLAHQARSHLERLQKLVGERTAKLQEANLSLQRKIFENKQSERRLVTQYAVGRALAEAATLADATEKIFQVICENLDWDWGAMWRVDAQANLLRFVNCRHAPVDSLEAFKTASQETACGPGSGLPGRAWSSAQPIWVRDVFQDPNFPRSTAASQGGLHTAVAFPLCIGSRVLGVMEFFSGEIRESDNDLLQTFAMIGSAIGQFMERIQAEEERKVMEVQLRHAQKLESIGQLAAGIAHEINTPTQFIGDNVRFLESSFGSLKNVYRQCEHVVRAAKQQAVTSELIAQAEEAAARADIDFLMGEIPNAIRQSLEGVARVAKIIRAMKDFSHPGTGEKTPLDLNRAIETTLTVAGNEWKYVASIVTDFDPLLPPVRCLPGELNQVILNLIVNAAHAIADVVGDGTKGKGVITASTRRCDDWAEIRIQDTGTGIAEKIRHKIFDPFFTTKPVGKGTGQGLAIAHTVVVDQHNGTLTVETEPGVGTVFIVRLPLNPATTPKHAEARP